jgi:hypothetical protein
MRWIIPGGFNQQHLNTPAAMSGNLTLQSTYKLHNGNEIPSLGFGERFFLSA